jgi:hypothetical protein
VLSGTQAAGASSRGIADCDLSSSTALAGHPETGKGKLPQPRNRRIKRVTCFFFARFHREVTKDM